MGKYWAFIEAPSDSPAKRPSQVRGWVHYREESGDTWGCRVHVENEADEQAVGWLEFFAKEAPELARYQRLELFSGSQRMLIVEIIGPHPEFARG